MTTRTEPPASPSPRGGQRMMRAIVQRAYGATDVLELHDITKPSPGPHDVLVAVHAASVNRADWLVPPGRPSILRVLLGLRRPRVPVRGRDLAGTVVTVGGAVTGFGPGDEVYAETTTGSFAEYACVPERLLAPKPTNLTFEQAAAVPLAAVTALQGLRDVGQVQPGQAVLINGASGGVGTFAVQIAKALGADVTGVCSTTNVELVRSLGADHVIDYTRTDFTTTGDRYDVILDNVEAQPLSETRRALTREGTLIPNSGEGGRWIGPLGRIATARATSVFTRQRLRPFLSRESRLDLVELAGLANAGELTPVIDRTFPLRRAPAAIEHIATRHARGKVVITV